MVAVVEFGAGLGVVFFVDIAVCVGLEEEVAVVEGFGLGIIVPVYKYGIFSCMLAPPCFRTGINPNTLIHPECHP